MLFAGVDVHSARPHVLAVVDGRLRLLHWGEGWDVAELVRPWMGGGLWVAVDAPRLMPAGLMDDEKFRQSLQPPPPPGKYLGWRVAEYLLRARCYVTPRSRDELPDWMRAGFAVYAELERLGFQAIDVLAPAQRRTARLVAMEYYPHAAFAAVLGCRLAPKRRPEGLEQRRQALRKVGLRGPLADLDADALDAAMGAAVAAMAWSGKAEMLGHEADGFIVMPVPGQLARGRGREAGQGG